MTPKMNLEQLKISIIYFFVSIIFWANALKFFPENREIIYEYVGYVKLVSQIPWDEVNSQLPEPSGWRVKGTLKLQRIDDNSLAAALAVEKVIIEKNGADEVFYQNKEMLSFYNPFKIVYNGDIISLVWFKDNDSLWAKNFKRAVASVLQIQGDNIGAFVEKEPGIHGVCSNEYYIAVKTNGHWAVRKTPELTTCTPHYGGIHSQRANVPVVSCNQDYERTVVVGYEAIYDLSSRLGQANNSKYLYSLNEAQIDGNSLLQTFESTGESQYIVSKLTLKLMSENEIVNPIDVSTNMSISSSLLIIEEHGSDYTGGRQPQESSSLVRESIDLLIALADSLEDTTLKLDEPYEGRVVEIIRLFGRFDLPSLQTLYREINIGTSYRQETVRNLFYDIIPRIGTKASVLLTRDLIVNLSCKPTTAIQLLVTLPFHISELSKELVKECEVLMALGPERPDVKHTGVLSFATIVYNSYVDKKIELDFFDKYVKKYFDLFLNAYDYEQKMLYLQGLRNLKLGKVIDYLDPIIRDEAQNNDIRFLAAFATLAVVNTRPERTYETYWPIFENRSAALELRVAAFVMLLFSNPTPARLISVHALMENETNPHLINFYRTTILSIAGTTHPCLQKYKRLTSYMIRHLPKAPAKRFWVTGNYLYDYRSNEYGIGAYMQALLIGDPLTDLPSIGIIRLDQEALGRYTGQHTIYIKARGLNEVSPFTQSTNKTQPGEDKSPLRKLLSNLRLPEFQNQPLHLEIIVLIEDKAVLSFHINQNTFHNLTDADIIQQVLVLLRTDSHINLQNLRWPFFARYSVPTVLGTPSSLSVQRTILSSLRGNITQTMLKDAVTRTHQIDVRHSTYAVVTSKSYNPFLNLEHSINREQGLLIYLPINNELTINIRLALLKFLFSGPRNLTCGISLKSRTRRIITGRILTKHEAPYHDTIVTEGNPNLKPSKLINHEIKNVGLTVIGESHPFDVVSHLRLLLNTKPTINTFVDQGDSDFDSILELWSILSVNEIHVGTNKKLELLFHNIRNNTLEGQIKAGAENSIAGQSENKFSEKLLIRLDINLVYKIDNEVLHNLDAVLKFNDFYKSKKPTLTTFVKYIDLQKQEWRLCSEGVYEPIVFPNKPYSLRANIVFGDAEDGQKGCPKNQTKLILNAIANVNENAHNLYQNSKQNQYEDVCPRQILKFNPPALSNYCQRDMFVDLTTINQYSLNISLQNSPQWLDDGLRRLDHFATAFSSQIKLFHFEKEINISLDTHSDKPHIIGKVNGQNVRIPNILLWLNEEIDAKFDTIQQCRADVGFIRTCNVINNQLNTFNDQQLELTLSANKDEPTILVADCSEFSRFALFISDAKGKFTLKLHVGNVSVVYTPQTDGKDILIVNGEEKIEILSEVRPAPDNEEFRVYINEENLIIFQIDDTTEVQYFREQILSIKVSPTIVGKLCGICSAAPISHAGISVRNSSWATI